MVLPPQQFRLDTDIPEDFPKRAKLLCRTDRVFCAVQVIRKGGENNLHSHSHLDGVWTVLSGRARFYGEGDQVIADLGPYEGVLIPRGVKYWFESASEELLVLHQVEASDVAMGDLKDLIKDRINHEERKEKFDSLVEDFAASEQG